MNGNARRKDRGSSRRNEPERAFRGSGILATDCSDQSFASKVSEPGAPTRAAGADQCKPVNSHQRRLDRSSSTPQMSRTISNGSIDEVMVHPGALP
jgi:hypothetical protein